MPCSSSVTLWNVMRSTGGAFSGRSVRSGEVHTIAASRPARRTSGSTASSQDARGSGGAETDGPAMAWGCVSGVTPPLLRTEQSHPSELRELGLVGVEHEVAGISERRLEDRALALAEHQRVGVF